MIAGIIALEKTSKEAYSARHEWVVFGLLINHFVVFEL